MQLCMAWWLGTETDREGSDHNAPFSWAGCDSRGRLPCLNRAGDLPECRPLECDATQSVFRTRLLTANLVATLYNLQTILTETIRQWHNTPRMSSFQSHFANTNNVANAIELIRPLSFSYAPKKSSVQWCEFCGLPTQKQCFKQGSAYG
jgi:hypothetical protein